jgi:hypothetical protein
LWVRRVFQDLVSGSGEGEQKVSQPHRPREDELAFTYSHFKNQSCFES